MLEMFSAARAFRIDNGTRVLVIDAGGGMFDPRVKLRALEGKTEGLAGWVRSAYVVSDNAVAAAVSDQVSAAARPTSAPQQVPAPVAALIASAPDAPVLMPPVGLQPFADQPITEAAAEDGNAAFRITWGKRGDSWAELSAMPTAKASEYQRFDGQPCPDGADYCVFYGLAASDWPT